jgi:hypothetical protein
MRWLACDLTFECTGQQCLHGMAMIIPFSSRWANCWACARRAPPSEHGSTAEESSYPHHPGRTLHQASGPFTPATCHSPFLIAKDCFSAPKALSGRATCAICTMTMRR